MTENEIIEPGSADESFALLARLQRELREEGKPDALTLNQKRFLAAYVQTLSVSESCRAAGISRTAHYFNRKNSPQYETIFKQLEEIASRMMLDSWLEDAHNGLERFKFDKNGEPLRHPETGEAYKERIIDTVARIFFSKSRFGLSDQPAPKASSGQSVQVVVLMPGNVAPSEPISIQFDQPEGSDNQPTDIRSLAHNPQDDSTNGVSDNE